jgi:hypothetical protein
MLPSDIKYVESTLIAPDSTTSNPGGAITTTVVNTAAPNAVFYQLVANPFGGADVVQYQKVGLYNSHATDSASSVRIYIANGINTLSGSATLSFSSTSASDNSTKKVRIIGLDASSNPQTHEINLNGTSTVTTTGITWTRVYRVELRNVASPFAFTTSVGTISMSHGVTAVGTILPGNSCLQDEFEIGMEGTINGSQTMSNAATAPTSVSFFKARGLANALTIQNGGVLGPSGGGSDRQGFYWKWTVEDGTAGTPDTTGYYPLLAVDCVV